ncbi:methyltransferase type 12 [Mycobacterium sp. E2462]|uniref:SAM-dependent methyltransferase n=1 Tax=unclassified Mycobacterium TaxID=2642494 RepID=UPI000801BAD5|nr:MULTISPECIES: SAM-dependent methyltransferase [unclassified Mycobacterium]OBG76171.1 methyltransferase type 12 [Mycobacterium sp. E1214]OBH28411.1 methyltransferase type 12 [Mycobacterium sp. E1319]OBI07517.1 methyltransferase type 12 [Mycobacterium sp. E2462]
MLGHLYDRALGGQRCWIRHEDGSTRPLPVHRWLGVRCPDPEFARSADDRSDDRSGDASDEAFDEAVTQMCTGPTIELGCGPGRLVARLIRRGIPALGIDRSATAIALAGRGGAPVLLSDVFDPLPAMGFWQTVLLVDGNVGLGGDPARILGRAVELLARGGRCVAEFDAESIGICSRWVRLESADEVGPWFRWASVGVDSAATLAAQVGLTLAGISLIGGRVIACLAA